MLVFPKPRMILNLAGKLKRKPFKARGYGCFLFEIELIMA
jgi:hypothetical protein